MNGAGDLKRKMAAILLVALGAIAGPSRVNATRIIDILYTECPNGSQVRASDEAMAASIAVYGDDAADLASKAARTAYLCSEQTSDPHIRDFALWLYNVDLFHSLRTTLDYQAKAPLIQNQLHDLMTTSKYDDVKKAAQDSYLRNEKVIQILANPATPSAATPHLRDHGASISPQIPG